MKRNLFMLLSGFTLGAIVVGLLALFIIRAVAKEKYEYGHYHGELGAKLAIANAVQDRLGTDFRKSDGHDTLFEVKADAVVVVERNGVKTLRVYNPMPSE